MNNNTSRRADDIRSDIDSTRQRMDQTIDALGERMKGRHLVDEVIGFFRTDTGQKGLTNVKSKVLDSTSSAARAVSDTVKANPIPLLLIGAGVGWMIYNSRRSNSEYLEGPYESDLGDDYSGGGYEAAGYEYSDGDYEDLAGQSYASEEGINEGGYASGVGPEVQGKFQQMKDTLGEKAGQAKDQLQSKAAQAKQQLQDKASQLKDRVSQTAHDVRDRASQMGQRVQESSREIYERSRQRVVSTVQDHPMEVGLGFLALGVAVGLALPTPRKVHQVVGPRVDRVKDRARETSRDIMNRGRSVVNAATDALRREAEVQGLTPEALRNKANAVAQSTKQAATDTARREGLTGDAEMGNQTQQQPVGNASGSSEA
jgi:ElaB/YqjD/DUF883 family membrane-anchored ribosome-binding protein